MTNDANFLLVEDNEDDVLLVCRAFNKAKILNPLHVVRNGEQSVAYLSGFGRYADRNQHPLPSVVLLDLKMPGMDGFDVLRWIRQQQVFQKLRVVVLSSSDLMPDVSRAYKLGANSFLIKPVDFERFVEISQALSGSWVWLNPADAEARAVASEPELAVASSGRPGPEEELRPVPGSASASPR
jgi:CheY-like chemotaxis protein